MQKISKILSFVLLGLVLVLGFLALPDLIQNPDVIGVTSALGYLLVLAGIFFWGIYKPSWLTIILTIFAIFGTVGAITMFVAFSSYA